MVFLRFQFRAGFSLLECVFALAVVSGFFVALYALNSQCLLTLNSGREALAARQSLQDRLEQLKSCTWAQVVDANYLKNKVLSASADSTINLGSPSETLTVNAYPAAISPQIKLVRAGGDTTTISSNAAMAAAEMVQVQVSLSWTARRGQRMRTQSIASVISKVQP